MAYDEELAERIRELLEGRAGVSERRMFGGLAFLIDRRMSVSASGRGGLLLRIDPARAEEFLAYPDVERFEMRGREMDGWLHIGAEAVATDADLARWVEHSVGYARSTGRAVGRTEMLVADR